MNCNGPRRPNTARPFLTAPYRGWTSIVSYFDHDLPNFSQDGLVVTATGLAAMPAPGHVASDFPAYWNSSLRQFVYYDGHNGYDYNLWYQPVYAAAPGTVIFAAFEYPTAPDHGYGRMVMIDHHNGYVTLYGHFSRLLVHAGQRVRRGQQIGVSGNTGHSSGPHLHFSVFHNCSPTDAYGWHGTGSDPLQGFQSESSTWLWEQAPFIANPLPHWPGMGMMPPTTAPRLVLLRLPSTKRGTRAFTRALASEERRTARFLRARGAIPSIDPLRGVVVVMGDVRAGSIYAAPNVASISTPDTEQGDRADFLAALANAGLSDPTPRVHVARSPAWTGYLLRWQGRGFLVGRGQRGKAVDLELQNRATRTAVHRLEADASTGAYAVDLGRMTPKQLETLRRELDGHGSGGSSVKVRAAAPRKSRSTTSAGPVPQSHDSVITWFAAGAILALFAALALLFGPRAIRGMPGDRE